MVATGDKYANSVDALVDVLGIEVFLRTASSVGDSKASGWSSLTGGVKIGPLEMTRRPLAALVRQR